LNLGNNNLDEKCGEMLEEATRYNETLIDFEFAFNNFKLDDVTPIHLFYYLYRLGRFKRT
jgi:hypothetical protein